MRAQDISGMVKPEPSDANSAAGFVKLRKSRGVTQKQIAEALDLSERTVLDWESGKRIPKLYIWQTKALCKLLDISIFEVPDSFSRSLDA